MEEVTEAVPLAQDETKGENKLLIVLRGLQDGSVDAQALAEALVEHGLSTQDVEVYLDDRRNEVSASTVCSARALSVFSLRRHSRSC